MIKSQKICDYILHPHVVIFKNQETEYIIKYSHNPLLIEFVTL